MSLPFGQQLLNSILPEKYHIGKSTTPKTLNKSLTALAKENPSVYSSTVAKLKRQGDEIATLEGLSIGLDDIEPRYTSRNKIISSAFRDINRLKDAKKRRAVLIQTQNALLDNVMTHKGTMGEQVKSGSRGKPIQLMKIVSSPVLATDGEGKVVPWLIKRSYSEGLKPSEYYITGNEARMNTIQANIAVSEPGDLSKILVSNMTDALVTSQDCGTDNGLSVSANSPEAIDRYLAKPAGNIQRNTLITPSVQTALKKLASTLIVRSAMTCENHEGVCQKCYGIDSAGNNPELGTNLGVRSAQALSEPLTQFALSAKHGIRIAGGDKKVLEGISGLRQLIEVPQVFINKAVLATKPGKVQKIEQAPQGGRNIFLEGIKNPFHIPPNLKPVVVAHQQVEAGDVLSEGIPKPDEVVKYKGLGEGRKHLVEQLKDLYKRQGQDVDQRHFELLAKSNLNHVRILDSPDNQFLKGDIVSYNALKRSLKESVKPLKVNDAIGETLGKEYLHYTAGTHVTPSKARYLREHGINEVITADTPPEVEFIMKPATRNPLLNPDWMARLAHRYLKQSILQGAHFGEISKLHGVNPIPAYAFGLEFGKGDKGKY